ncbi:MAG TPA: hypothetical protein PK432_00845 [Candidatus Dojkabacteria bacterium]|nr:hypothetical protein [Candidatus Dojkabacteria bacterium]
MALSKNCTPVSSSCVIWNGPKIECIDQCQNDSIEDIVYRLGQIICSLSEMSQSDCNCDNKIDNLLYNCLITDQQIPQWGEGGKGWTGQQLLEIYAEELCSRANGNVTVQDLVTLHKKINQPLALKDHLQYEEDGQTITELTYDQYILLLAQWVCDLYDTLVTQQSNITTIQNDILIIRQWIDNYKEPNKLTITSGYASAANPGETVNIDTAFETFEARYCDYISVLGSTTKWTTAMSTMCPMLATEPQMQNLDLDMKDLANWIPNPNTVAENYNNLWLTVCDLRTALQTLLESKAILPCVLISPNSVTIDSYNTISANISWTISSLTNIQSPIGFSLEIWEWNGTTEGNLVYSNTYGDDVFTANVISTSIIAGREYIVKIKALYSCGESSAITVIGYLKEPIILYNINISESSDVGVTTSCDEGAGPSDYPYITTTTTYDLVNANTGLPATLATDLTIVVKHTITHPDYGVFTSNVPVTIPAGSSTVDYKYVSKQTILSSSGTCESVTRVLTCGISINNSNCAFGNGIIEC